MNALTLLDHAFEGKKITTIIYRGRPCWLAREVGATIGYSHEGKRFANKVTKEWGQEMIRGHDYDVLAGEDLEQLRGAMAHLGTDSVPSSRLGTDYVPGHTRHVTVLYEAGLWLCLAKSEMELGRKLRRFLVDNVLPQIARDGRYSPEREVTPEGQLVAREAAQAAEERRLEIEREKIAVEKRRLAAEGLWRLCDVLKDATYLGDDIKKSLAVAAAEEASGRSLAGFLPPADASFHWESPTEIGKRLGLSSNAVGKAITALGLRGVEGMSREIVNKAQHSNRTVTSWLYSPEAVARIEAHLRGS